MRRLLPARSRAGVRFTRSMAALGAVAIVMTIGLASAAPGAADSPAAVPYQLPVQLPTSLSSPAVDASAPYTPAVMSLISQLLPTSTPTLAQIQNAATLLHDGSNTTCNAVGPVSGPVGLDSSGNPTATTLSAATAVGATNIKVASVTGWTVGETIWIDVTSSAEQATIANVGTAGVERHRHRPDEPADEGALERTGRLLHAHDAEHHEAVLGGRAGDQPDRRPERARRRRARTARR